MRDLIADAKARGLTVSEATDLLVANGLQLRRSRVGELMAAAPVRVTQDLPERRMTTLVALLEEAGADALARAIWRTREPARTVGRVLDACATWALEATEPADPEADEPEEGDEP